MKAKFSKNIFGDKEAYYMSCPEVVSNHLAKTISHFTTAIELCCAIGMNAVILAQKIDRVIGIDNNKKRIDNAIKNAKLYDVSNKTIFIHGDVTDVNLLNKFSADVAILDPDWSSGDTEKSIHVSDLDSTQPSIRILFNITKKHITSNIIIRIPKTISFETISKLGPCKVENIHWDNKLKFRIAYFLDNINSNSEEDIFF